MKVLELVFTLHLFFNNLLAIKVDITYDSFPYEYLKVYTSDISMCSKFKSIYVTENKVDGTVTCRCGTGEVFFGLKGELPICQNENSGTTTGCSCGLDKCILMLPVSYIGWLIRGTFVNLVCHASTADVKVYMWDGKDFLLTEYSSDFQFTFDTASKPGNTDWTLYWRGQPSYTPYAGRLIRFGVFCDNTFTYSRCFVLKGHGTYSMNIFHPLLPTTTTSTPTPTTKSTSTSTSTKFASTLPTTKTSASTIMTIFSSTSTKSTSTPTTTKFTSTSTTKKKSTSTMMMTFTSTLIKSTSTPTMNSTSTLATSKLTTTSAPLATSTIVAIGIGCFAGAIIAVVIAYVCCRRKKSSNEVATDSTGNEVIFNNLRTRKPGINREMSNQQSQAQDNASVSISPTSNNTESPAIANQNFVLKATQDEPGTGIPVQDSKEFNA